MHDIVNALGWMLVHFLWQGCLVALGFAAVCAIAPRDAVSLRYWAGLAGYVAILVLPAITFWWHLEPSGAAAPSLALPAIEISTGYPVAPGELLRHGLEPVLPWLVVLWALGVGLMSLRAVAGWYGARQLLRQGVEAVEAPVRRLAGELAQRMGVWPQVTVLRSTQVDVPSVVGWLEPVILLPAGVLGRMPREQLALVLAHELAHVRRNDYLVNLLQLVVETLFFYHPAVAWLGRRVREDREHCCDDEVVACFGERLEYARALAGLERLRAPSSPALAATGGDLYRRVGRIVQCDPPRRSAGFAHVVLVAGLAAVTAVGLHQGLDPGQRFERPAVTTLPEPAGAPPFIGALGQGMRQLEAQQRAQPVQRVSAAMVFDLAPPPPLPEHWQPALHRAETAIMPTHPGWDTVRLAHLSEPPSPTPDLGLPPEAEPLALQRVEPRLSSRASRRDTARLNLRPPCRRITGSHLCRFRDN